MQTALSKREDDEEEGCRWQRFDDGKFRMGDDGRGEDGVAVRSPLASGSNEVAVGCFTRPSLLEHLRCLTNGAYDSILLLT